MRLRRRYASPVACFRLIDGSRLLPRFVSAMMNYGLHRGVGFNEQAESLTRKRRSFAATACFAHSRPAPSAAEPISILRVAAAGQRFRWAFAPDSRIDATAGFSVAAWRRCEARLRRYYLIAGRCLRLLAWRYSLSRSMPLSAALRCVIAAGFARSRC